VNPHLLAEFALMDWVHKKGSRSSRLSYLARTERSQHNGALYESPDSFANMLGADALTANDRHH